MSLEALEGRTYGPIPARISAEKVAEFVSATGDDPRRWSDIAPPGFAGALLFRAAPMFIHSPEVGTQTRVLVHSEQRFTWHRALDVGLETAILGTVSRVRVRGDLNFVTFDVSVAADDGPVIDSSSTFLMGSSAAAEPGPDPGEPDVTLGGSQTYRPALADVVVGAELEPVNRSASRLDLVRYAGASGDFNPIHFDHEAARAAGLDGIVVHGLYMLSWLAQLAVSGSSLGNPLVDMKVRFRSALRPGTPAVASGRWGDVANGRVGVTLRLTADDIDLVTATATIRTGA